VVPASFNWVKQIAAGTPTYGVLAALWLIAVRLSGQAAGILAGYWYRMIHL